MLSIDMIIDDKLQNGRFNFPRKKGAYQVPATCGLSRKRLNVPAIGRNCKHKARMELQLLLAKINESGKWNCPVCFNKLPLCDILIDQQMLEVLEENEQSQQIQWIRFDNDKAEIIMRITDGRRSLLQSVFGQSGSMQGVSGQMSNVLDEVNISMGSIVTQKLKEYDLNISELNAVSSTLKTPALQENSKIIPSTVYWMEWGEPTVFKFLLQQNAWQRCHRFGNIAISVQNYLALYGETHVFLMGGVNLQHEAQRWAFYASEESGINRLRKMRTARHSFCGLIYNKTIYVFGGIGKNGIVSECERFSFQTQRWAQMQDMPEPRAMQTVVHTTQGNMYLFGGSTPSFHLCDEVLHYDCITDQWTVIKVQFPQPIRQSLAIFVEDWNQVLIIGGVGQRGNSKQLLLFDIYACQFELSLPQLQNAFYNDYKQSYMFDKESKVIHFFLEQDRKMSHYYINLGILKQQDDEFGIDEVESSVSSSDSQSDNSK